ncbi:hypothetical protein [Streptomyces sp. L2]|uniref:hypothetical protein n=1 Tax=Streptomyces sp. L2 TaxID=2162665 RepID=UPI0013E9143C|nr:hypothetical protein [Streptomyces sp. L2]
MSEEPVPRADAPSSRPKGLLEQMEELMAALNADLSDLHQEAESRGRLSGSAGD